MLSDAFSVSSNPGQNTEQEDNQQAPAMIVIRHEVQEGEGCGYAGHTGSHAGNHQSGVSVRNQAVGTARHGVQDIGAAAGVGFFLVVVHQLTDKGAGKDNRICGAMGGDDAEHRHEIGHQLRAADRLALGNDPGRKRVHRAALAGNLDQ